MKYYSGNRAPFVLALFSERDRDRVRETVEAMESAPFRVAPLTSRPSRSTARRACALLVFLSAGFARNRGLQDVFFDAKSAGVPVIPIQLDDAVMPEIITQALYAKNSIVARKYPTARSLAQRIMTAEVLTAPSLSAEQRKISRIRMGAAALAAAVVLAVGAYKVVSSLDVFSFKPVLRQQEEQVDTLGLTQADLDNICYAVFVGDHFRFYSRDELDDFALGRFFENAPAEYHLAYQMEDGSRKWIWQEDDTEAKITPYDLRILSKLRNLQGLDLALVDAEALPDLRDLKKLEYIALRDCTITDISGVPTEKLHTFTTNGTQVADYSPLNQCRELRNVIIHANGQRLGDFSNFGPANLQHFEIEDPQPNEPARDFPMLKNCKVLNSLVLHGLDISNLDFLPNSAALRQVILRDMDRLEDVSRLGDLPTLADITIISCRQIRDLTMLDRCEKLKRVHLQDLPRIHDASFLSGMKDVEYLMLELELEDLDFLKDLANSAPYALELGRGIGDYSGLAAAGSYLSLSINAESIRKVMPYIENCIIRDELDLYGCKDLDLAHMPILTGKLKLDHCTVSNLKGLRETVKALELINLPFLTSLEGAKEVDLIQNITIVGCPRLSDWTALRRKLLNSYVQQGGLAVPDFSKFSVKSELVLENIPDLRDLSCFDNLTEKSITANVRLAGLTGLTDTSGMNKLRGSTLSVSPELKEQAQTLVELRQFERCQVVNADAVIVDNQPLQLVSLDELDIMPSSVLNRVNEAYILGDTVYDPRLNIRIFNPTPHLEDSFDGSYIRTEKGKITDVGVLAPLNNLETLYLDNQPLQSLSGIEKLPKLRRLSVSVNKNLSDLTAVYALNELEELEFSNTAVSTLEGIGNLPHLTALRFWDTEVTDLEPLFKWNHGFADDQYGGVSLDFGGTKVIRNLETLGTIPRYNYLCMRDRNLDAETLFPAMQYVQVRKFDLGRTNLSTRGLKLLTENIRGLEELRLDHAVHVTDLTALLQVDTLQRVVVSRDMKAAIRSLENKEYHFELITE